MRSLFFAFTLFAGLFVASRATADAALRVCDTTSQPVSVAIAMLGPSSTGVQSQSEGWFQIDAQTCAIVIDAPLNPTALYYLYAKTAKITWAGNAQATRDSEFCTDFAGRFSYTDRPAALCTGAGEQMLRFIYEPATSPDWTIDLDSP
jgi:uncharacterized membrane protein